MGKKRDYISLEIELAAALGQLAGIPHEHRKAMTARQIRSLFQRHHDPIPKHLDGPDEHWNIQWTLILEHRFVSATETTPMVKRADRISEETAEFRHRMLVKSGQAEPVEPKPEPKRNRFGSRPLKSRSSFGRASKDGQQRRKPSL